MVRKNGCITAKEIQKAKEKIQVGDRVLIRKRFPSLNGLGNIEKAVRVTVLSKHQRIVCLSGNLSCTYVQLAIWMRNRREAIR